jgi:hypothetical protein
MTMKVKKMSLTTESTVKMNQEKVLVRILFQPPCQQTRKVHLPHLKIPKTQIKAYLQQRADMRMNKILKYSIQMHPLIIHKIDFQIKDLLIINNLSKKSKWVNSQLLA